MFGALSDKIGRKPIILAGCLIAALTYFPIFKAITTNANPALEKAIETVKVEVIADPAQCGDLFNPVGTRVFTAPCDTGPRLPRAAVGEVSTTYKAGSPRAGLDQRHGYALHHAATSNAPLLAAVQAAGYPKPGDTGIVKMTHPFDIFKRTAAIVGLLLILVIYVTMVYGPIAAALVELFPTRIRYTSMSLPYHIGNGWFGGLLPATAFAIVASTGDIYAGLWYPIVFALITAVVGFLFVPETKDVDITKAHLIPREPIPKRSGRAAMRGRFACRVPQSDRSPTNCSTISRRCGRVAMLDEIDRPARCRAPARRPCTGTCSDVAGQHRLDVRRHVVGTFGCRVRQPASLGSEPARARWSGPSSTSGSAFSWIVSEAEVWRMNSSVTAPSRPPRLAHEVRDLGS